MTNTVHLADFSTEEREDLMSICATLKSGVQDAREQRRSFGPYRWSVIMNGPDRVRFPSYQAARELQEARRACLIDGEDITPAIREAMAR